MVVSVKMIQLIQWTIWSGVMVKFQIPNTPSQTQNTSSQIPNAPSKIQRNYDAFFFTWNCWYIFMKAAVSSFPRVGAPGQSKILLNSDPFPFGREPSGWLPSGRWLPSGGWLALGGCKAFEEKLSRECTIRLSTLLFLSGSRIPLQKQIHLIRTLFHWKWNENEMKVK